MQKPKDIMDLILRSVLGIRGRADRDNNPITGTTR
jgi:hypothetical protein